MVERKGTRRRERALQAYVCGAAIAGGLVLGLLVQRGLDTRPPAPLGLLLIAMIVAEIFPMSVPWRNQTLRFTMSTTFGLMIMFAYGPALAALAQFALWVAVFSLQRSGWMKVAFNSSQVVLCFAAASLVAEALGVRLGGDHSLVDSLDAGTLGAMLLAVATFLICNIGFISVARSLSSDVPLRRIVSTALNGELFMELGAMLFVPVLLLSFALSSLLFVLTLIPMVAFYFAIKFALQNGVLLEEKNRDLQAHQETERRLRQAQKMEAVGQLAGGVAHDFNNLLSVILNYAQFARAEVKPDDPMRADLDEIVNAGQKAARLTRQLLSFSRQEVLAPEVLSVHDVVSEMDRMLRRTIGEHIEMETATGECPSVRMDRGQLEQIVLNLALNARDAMESGGRLRIETDAVTIVGDRHDPCEPSEPGYYARLRVGDTGTGISADDLDRIFEPFFTTKEPGTGTGLGLATVYGAVQHNGGFLDVTSEVGRGTVFTIFLPAAPEEDGAMVRLDKPSVDLEGRTVLLVEDEDAVRVMVTRLLKRRLGAEVLAAGSGPEALEISRRHEGAIDLLITDVVMPQMSGKDLSRHLARERPETPVLFMSGYTKRQVAAQGVLEEGEHLVQKPFDADALREAVGRVLSSHAPIAA